MESKSSLGDARSSATSRDRSIDDPIERRVRSVAMPKNIVKRAAEFCALPKFERVFDDFARDNADAFLDAVEAKGGEVEHKHEYKALHDKYLQLFEAELSDFVESEGSTIDEFFSECREIFEGQYTALFEEHQYAWFVEHLLACMDYKHFYGLMVNEARRQSRK